MNIPDSMRTENGGIYITPPFEEPMYGLWVAVHDYLVAQANPDPTVLTKAYANLVEAHNDRYRRYYHILDEAPEVAGS